MVQSEPAYDELPYTGLAYWFCHPDLLGLFGALHGLDTARAGRCRVLEVGCGDGGNLLSLASILPGSHFTGIDLSAVQIHQGQELAELAGLRNVSLHHADLTTFAVEPGSFDYVIAHGVYSWVPADARDGLLALAARALAPNGVALVSYNAMPGQSQFTPVRDLMLFHTQPLPDARTKVIRAREIGRAWCEYLDAHHAETRKATARRVGGVLQRLSPTALRHDYLAEFGDPVWFTDFVAHAGAHGLVYLDNGLPGQQRPELLEPEAREMLLRLPDRVRAQQYFDFFEDTRFRVTLLARADAPRQAPLALSTLALEDRMNVTVDPATFTPTPRVVVENISGKVEVTDLATRIALGAIVERAPRTMPMLELRDLVSARLEQFDPSPLPLFPPTEAGRAALLAHLEAAMGNLWRRDVVHRWRDPPPSAGTHDRRRPETARLQRVLAARGAVVPSLYHRHVELDAAELELLAALDGQSDVDALVARFGPETEARLTRLWRQRLLLD